MAAGIATSTVKSYGTGRRRYEDFCWECGLTPYPASEEVLLCFIACLGMQKISHKTIKAYLSAIRHHHVVSGLSFCGYSSRVYLVLQGVKRCNGVPQNSRLPITVDLLRTIKKALQKDIHSFENVMLWAACNVGFFSFLRSGELVLSDGEQFQEDLHLSFLSVSVDDPVDDPKKPQAVIIRLKRSKTDPFRSGVSVYLARTLKELCPVEALLAYLHIRSTAPGPLYRLEDGNPLRKSKFISLVRLALASQGVADKGYSGHSFRIGAATSAAMQGISDSNIKLLGRWESLAFLSYIETPRSQLASFTRQLVQ